MFLKRWLNRSGSRGPRPCSRNTQLSLTNRVQRGLLDLSYGLVPGATSTPLPQEHFEDIVSVSKFTEGLSRGCLERFTGGLCPLEGTKSGKGEPLSQALSTSHLPRPEPSWGCMNFSHLVTSLILRLLAAATSVDLILPA